VSEGRDLSLTREQIIGLLAELGQELDARGVKAHLFVVGGAVMALAYNMRRTTVLCPRPSSSCRRCSPRTRPSPRRREYPLA
jgi:hypothetical protein